MKKAILVLGLCVSLCACDKTPVGTLQPLYHQDTIVEVYKYYYAAGSWIFIARFKDQPKVVTTTWIEGQGKYSEKKFDITH